MNAEKALADVHRHFCVPDQHDDAHLALLEAVARHTALRVDLATLIPSECWVTRSTSELRCTAMIGGGFENGAKWTEDMCCLPCRLRTLVDRDTQ